MSDHPAAKPRGGVLKWVLWGAALIGVAAVVYIIAQSSSKAPTEVTTGPASPAPMKTVSERLEHPSDGALPPDTEILDADGRSIKISDFKGKVLVMNLWATWCAPCVAEMPTLARLQAAYAGKPVVVAPISVDSETSLEKARAFIAEHPPLVFYNDPKMKLPFDLVPPAPGMPTTVIYGADGRERARVSGDADWSGPDAKAIIDRLLSEGTTPPGG